MRLLVVGGLLVGLALGASGFAEASAPQDRVIWTFENRLRVFARPDISNNRHIADLADRGEEAQFYDAVRDSLASNMPQGRGDLEQPFQQALSALREGEVWVRLKLSEAQASKCVWLLAEATRSGPCDVETSLPITIALDRSEPISGSVTYDGQSHPFKIQPRVRVLAGLGDSFASGEGSPDVPADLTQVDWGTGLPGDWFAKGREYRATAQAVAARWGDQGCHRSAFNHQTLAALRVAASNPQDLTVFIHLSCSGASLFNGVLTPQNSLPGGSGHPEASQLQLLERIRCRDRVTTIDEADQLPQRVGWKGRGNPRRRLAPLQSCAPADRLKIDRLLLSAGGNDIGFSGLIAWAILPEGYAGSVSEIGLRALDGQIVCPDREYGARCSRQTSADDHINGYNGVAGLDDVYIAARRYFDVVGIPPEGIFQITYPNPLRSARFGPSDDLRTGLHCPLLRNEEARQLGLPLNLKGDNLVSPGLEAVLAQVSLSHVPGVGRLLRQVRSDRDLQSGFQIAVAPSEAAAIDGLSVRDLNTHIISAKGGWRVVDVSRLADGRGWCAVDDRDTAGDQTRLNDAVAELEELRGPWRVRWDGERNVLSAERSAPFDALARRARLFRTPNDSVLAQWDGEASSLAGMFHPTAELQALMSGALAAAILEGRGSIQ